MLALTTVLIPTDCEAQGNSAGGVQFPIETLAVNPRFEWETTVRNDRIAGGVLLGSGFAGMGISAVNLALYSQLKELDYMGVEEDRAFNSIFIAGGAGIVSTIIALCLFSDADLLSNYMQGNPDEFVMLTPTPSGLSLIGKW